MHSTPACHVVALAKMKALAKFERPKHLFATRARRRAEIALSQNEHHRRLHVLDIINRRATFEILLVLEGRRFEPCRLKQSKIRRVPPSCPISDIALRDRRPEAVRLSHDPIGEQAAAATSSYAKLFVIDIAAPHHLVDASHQ